jgi:N-acetylneuraminic acid mutarotase
MPTPRGALAAVAVENKIYVIGGAKIPAGRELADGLNAGGPVEVLGTMEVFDTEKNSWTTLKPMPLARNHHDVAFLDGKLYVVGGTIGSCFPGGWSANVSMNEVYDIAADAWFTAAPMTSARSGIAAAAMDGKIFVIGGTGWADDLTGIFRANEAYDPKTNSWSDVAGMPTPRHNFAKGVVDGKLYAVSGITRAAAMFSIVAVNEVFTP